MQRIKLPKTILFVCTGNTCRSVMAEGIFQKMLKEMGKEDFKFISSGTNVLPGMRPPREVEGMMKKEGIDIIRGRTAKIEEKNGHLVLRSEDIEGMKLIEKEVDMVVLAIGLEPGEDSQKLAKSLNLLTDDVGWFAELDSTNQPVNTVRGGIFVAGVCQGPKDIPDSVAQGSAAAARVIQSVINNKVKKGLSDLSYNDIETKVNELENTKVKHG